MSVSVCWAAHGAAWDGPARLAGRRLLQSTEWGQRPERRATDVRFPTGPRAKLLPGRGQPVCLSRSLCRAFGLAKPICKLLCRPRVEEAG